VTCLPSWFPIIFPWGETEEFYANILGLHFYPKILWWSSHPLIFGAWRLVFWFESASPWLLGDVITLLGSKPQVKDMLQIKISFPSPVVTPQLLRQVISGRNYLNCHMKLLHIKQLTQAKIIKVYKFFHFYFRDHKILEKTKTMTHHRNKSLIWGYKCNLWQRISMGIQRDTNWCPGRPLALKYLSFGFVGIASIKVS
jgi:hypothetical protein